MWAQRQDDVVDGREFMHFGQRGWVEGCYGGPAVPVRLVEDPEGQYWGWLHSERDGLFPRRASTTPEMVQPHQGMYTMQFPYGPKAEEERGHGRTVRLSVTGLDGIDLDDTSRCPTAPECEACNGIHGALLLDAVVVTTDIGLYCATLCGWCQEDGVGPADPGGYPGAVKRIWAHCEHLSIDPDEMAALIELETTS